MEEETKNVDNIQLPSNQINNLTVICNEEKNVNDSQNIKLSDSRQSLDERTSHPCDVQRLSEIGIFLTFAIFGAYASLHDIQSIVKNFDLPHSLFNKNLQIALLSLSLVMLSILFITAIIEYRKSSPRYETHNIFLYKKSNALLIFALFFCLVSVGIYMSHLYFAKLESSIALAWLAVGLLALGLSLHLNHRSGRLENKKKYYTSISAITMLFGFLSISLSIYQMLAPVKFNPSYLKFFDVSFLSLSALSSLFVVISIIYSFFPQNKKIFYDPNIRKSIPNKLYFLEKRYPGKSEYLLYKFCVGKFIKENFNFLKVTDEFYLSLQNIIFPQTFEDNDLIIERINHIYQHYILTSGKHAINISGDCRGKLRAQFDRNNKLINTNLSGVTQFFKKLKVAYNEIYYLFKSEKNSYLETIPSYANIKYNRYLIYAPIIGTALMTSAAVITGVCLVNFDQMKFSLSTALLFISALALFGGLVGYCIGAKQLNNKMSGAIKKMDRENIGYKTRQTHPDQLSL